MASIFDKIHDYDPTDPEPLENLIPPKIYYLAHHLHNLIYIRYFYEQIGQQPPVWTTGEMGRAQKHLLQQLDLESGQGGKLREGVRHEARQSRQEQSDIAEGRAERPSRQSRGG